MASFVTSVAQCGYRRDGWRHAQAIAAPARVHVQRGDNPDATSRGGRDEHREPAAGLDGDAYQWIDLDGEGVSGVLTEQATAWYYKRNLSPTQP